MKRKEIIMKKMLVVLSVAILCLFACAPGFAQQNQIVLNIPIT